MSKASKARSSAKRKTGKAAKKAANRAMFQELAAKGLNQKKKGKNAKKKFKPHDHPDGRCTNIGCRKCDPFHVFYSVSKTPAFKNK